MKVFNLTDVETPKLRQHGMLNQTFAVGEKMLSPGQGEDVSEETLTRVRHELQDLVMMGACAVDTMPPEYIVAREQAVKAKASKDKPAEEPAPTAEETPVPAGRRGGR